MFLAVHYMLRNKIYGDPYKIWSVVSFGQKFTVKLIHVFFLYAYYYWFQRSTDFNDMKNKYSLESHFTP